MSVQDKLQAALDTLGPQRSTTNPMDSEFADIETIARPQSREDSTIDFSEFNRTPASPAQAAAPKQGDLSPEDAVQFQRFLETKSFDTRMTAFCQRHKIVQQSEVNGNIFGDYLKATGVNGDLSKVTDVELEDFYDSSRDYIETTDNTPPLPNPDKPAVIYLPDGSRPKPVQTGLSAGGCQAPAAPAPENLTATLDGMSRDDQRRYIQHLMFAQSRERNQQ
jgi:hypothetical protein